MGRPHELDIRIHGKLMKRFSVGGEAKGRPAPQTFTIAEFGDPEWEEYVHHADDALEVRVPVEGGPAPGERVVRAARVGAGRHLPTQTSGRTAVQRRSDRRQRSVSAVAIGGPYHVTGSGDTPSRREVFVCRPQREADEQDCARRIVSKLARHAYRRTATDRHIQPL